MKKIISVALTALAFLFVNPEVGFSQHRHSGGGTPTTGGQSSGGYSRGGYSHGGYSHGGYSHGSNVYYSGSVWFGPGWGWGPAYPYYYPYYNYPYYYPYYTAPPVAIQQAPTQYIQRDQENGEPAYWYFCRKPEGYYPYVKRCPNGWLRVVPSTKPSDE